MREGDFIGELKRSKKITFRLTDSEFETLQQNVLTAGQKSKEVYIRKMVLGGTIVRLDLSEIQETLRLLANATGNINQLAKRANETRSIYETDIIALRKQVQALTLHVREIYKVYKQVKSLFGDTA